MLLLATDSTTVALYLVAAILAIVGGVLAAVERSFTIALACGSIAFIALGLWWTVA